MLYPPIIIFISRLKTGPEDEPNMHGYVRMLIVLVWNILAGNEEGDVLETCDGLVWCAQFFAVATRAHACDTSVCVNVKLDIRLVSNVILGELFSW